MSSYDSLQEMAGLGQFGSDQFSWSAQYGLGRKSTTSELSPGARKNMGMMGTMQQPQQPPPPPQPQPGQPPLQQQQQQKPRKGFFGEDDDPGIYRPDKEMLTSNSPSQLSAPFGANFYNQGLGNLSGLAARGMSGAAMQQRNTPTSMNPNFPINLQQPQASPNRGIIPAVGQRSMLNPSQLNHPMPNIQQQKQRTSLASSLVSTSSAAPISSLGSFGMPPNRTPGSSDSAQSNLDLTEFPTLGNRAITNNPLPAVRSYGMVSKPVVEPTPEFQIQQEDFPALPGAQNPPTTTASEARKTPMGLSMASFDPTVSKDMPKFMLEKTNNNQTKRGIQTHPDGTVSNIPADMVMDQFGIVGLLTFIRTAETDPNLVALAPGIDLTTLGLNLNSPDNLYSTFQSPWADAPCRPQDIDFHVPAEYLTNIFIRDKLAPIKLNRYGEDLLFLLFYMNGGDVLQLAAAAELYNRDWRYHKEERVWITRAPGFDPIMKTNTYERGTYYFFDAQNWRKVAKEFYLEYDKLEERPHLPPTLHHNPNQPTVAQ